MFDNSAMDGYAVCDLSRTEWDIIGVVAAGDDVTAISLSPGQAVRIFTGAGIPANTDSVVPQENTSINNNKVLVEQALKPAANIRRQGEELKKRRYPGFIPYGYFSGGHRVVSQPRLCQHQLLQAPYPNPVFYWR